MRLTIAVTRPAYTCTALTNATRSRPLAAALATPHVQIFDAHGRIAHWDGYQGMLEYILYKQLGWPAGDEGYLLLTKNGPVATRADRERATQLAFEAFNVKGLYLLDVGVAAVYASGTSSGVAVDIGHSGTTVTQVRCSARAVLGACCCFAHEVCARRDVLCAMALSVPLQQEAEWPAHSLHDAIASTARAMSTTCINASHLSHDHVHT